MTDEQDEDQTILSATDGDGEIVGSLRFRIPAYGGSATISPGGGTLDLGEVETGLAVVEEVIPIYGGRMFRVGRAPTNDLIISNPSVSRHHVIFSGSRSGIVLSDLSSLNGTTCNGKRVSAPIQLNHGDQIKIGSVHVTVELAGQMASEEIQEGEALSTHGASRQLVSVTVVVADICAYTRMTQALPPSDVVTMLDRWCRRMAEITRSHGGEVDKFIGDCTMSLWMSEVGNDSLSARNAVRAAADMLQATKALVEEAAWMHQDTFPWGCRIAVHSGDALRGAIGGAQAREFTVLGDAVNVAFRLEKVAASKSVDILISGATAAHVGDAFPLVSLGPVIIPGRTETVEAYTF